MRASGAPWLCFGAPLALISVSRICSGQSKTPSLLVGDATFVPFYVVCSPIPIFNWPAGNIQWMSGEAPIVFSLEEIQELCIWRFCQTFAFAKQKYLQSVPRESLKWHLLSFLNPNVWQTVEKPYEFLEMLALNWNNIEITFIIHNSNQVFKFSNSATIM